MANGKYNFDESSNLLRHEQPTKRNPGGDGHLSDALLRLLRIQNMDEDGEAVVEFVDTSDPAVRARLRYPSIYMLSFVILKTVRHIY